VTTTTSPAWLTTPAPARKSLRFVWQTDADGRFIHVSRELTEAVGLPNGLILGKTWRKVMDDNVISGDEGITTGFDSRDTWSAGSTLWPVSGDNTAVPVEMAGSVVRERGAFAGFRGYGIARPQDAEAWSRPIEQNPAADPKPDTPRADIRLVEPTNVMLADRSVTEGLRDPVLRDLRQQSRNTASVSEQEPEAGTPAPAPAKPHAVAMLQGMIGSALTTAEPVHSTEKSPAQPSLSATERQAFRDIAKALGAPELTNQNEVKDDQETVPSAPVEQNADGSKPDESVDLPVVRPTPFKTLIQRRKHLPEVPPRAEPDTAPVRSVLKRFVTDRRKSSAKISTVEGGKPRLRSIPTPAETNAALETAGRQIVESLSVPVMIMQNGEGVYVNPAMLGLLGRSDDTAILTPGGAEAIFATRPDHPDGSPHTVALIGAGGHILKTHAAMHAITWTGAPAVLMSFTEISDAVAPATALNQTTVELELIAALNELRELKAVLDTATDGVVTIDGEGRILGMNRSAEALFGFDQNEVIGEKLTTLLEPDSHLAAMDYLDGLKTSGVASILNDGREVKGRERHGGVIPLFMTMGRLNEGGDSARFCTVLRDVSTWKKTEANLADAKRAAEDSDAHKTDFLASISHEIRTPLNAIIGFAEAMTTESFGPLGNERYQQYAKDIQTSGHHVISLVNDLLDLTKVAAGKMELTFAAVDANAVLGSCIDMMQPIANNTRVIVRSQFAEGLPAVVADERATRQIVLNLLSNAARFTEPGGQIVASTALTERGEVAIRIRDTGIGMTPEQLKLAMEPFKQVHGERSSGGTGLGLPLTKALADANRAELMLSSETGKGTLAEVIFPPTRVLAE
jgi:PAS domain S-box-containing protein